MANVAPVPVVLAQVVVSSPGSRADDGWTRGIRRRAARIDGERCDIRCAYTALFERRDYCRAAIDFLRAIYQEFRDRGRPAAPRFTYGQILSYCHARARHRTRRVADVKWTRPSGRCGGRVATGRMGASRLRAHTALRGSWRDADDARNAYGVCEFLRQHSRTPSSMSPVGL